MTDFLQQYGPQIAAMAPSFVAGFAAGKFAKKALKKTLIVSGIGLAVLAISGVAGIDAETAKQLAQTGSSWLSENLEGVGAYIAALLPSATAAVAGATLGFRGGPPDEAALKDKFVDAGKEGVKSRVTSKRRPG